MAVLPPAGAWVLLAAAAIAGSAHIPRLVVAGVISNLLEGLSGAAGMKRKGRSARCVFDLLTGLVVTLGLVTAFALTRT